MHFKSILTTFKSATILDHLFLNKIHVPCYKYLNRNRGDWIILIEYITVDGKCGNGRLVDG